MINFFRVLQALPRNIPALATTATANNRIEMTSCYLAFRTSP
ncbi:hypothetical protein M595_0168 [Lyngbya aestuarii BL J]|uniref:Uncharacterized protein n=1 Tax=Lyngbya aestuarii BL J TaxID=1348334 RepID=U7QRL0_9CYAN|nr:hypothetical protein M595_0168 [Lyngbya aestuarii BL J]